MSNGNALLKLINSVLDLATDGERTPEPRKRQRSIWWRWLKKPSRTLAIRADEKELELAIRLRNPMFQPGWSATRSACGKSSPT